MSGFRSLFVDNGSDYDDIVVYDDTYVDLGTVYPGMGYDGRMAKKVLTEAEMERRLKETKIKRRATMLGYGLKEDDELFEILLVFPDILFDGIMAEEEAKFRARTIVEVEDNSPTEVSALPASNEVTGTYETVPVAIIDELYIVENMVDVKETTASSGTESGVIVDAQIEVDDSQTLVAHGAAEGEPSIAIEGTKSTDDNLMISSDVSTKSCKRIDCYGMYLKGTHTWDEVCVAANALAKGYGWPLENEVDSFSVTFDEFCVLELQFCPYVVETVLEGSDQFDELIATLVHEREVLFSPEYDSDDASTVNSDIVFMNCVAGTRYETGGGNSVIKGMSTGTAVLSDIAESVDSVGVVTEQEIQAAEEKDVTDSDFIASALTDGKLVGAEVTGVVWDYVAVDDHDGLSWVNVGNKSSIQEDVPVVLQISDDAVPACHEQIVSLVDTKAVAKVGMAPSPVAISGSEVVGALSGLPELEMVGMVTAAEFGPAGIVVDGVLIAATDIVADALGGTAGDTLSGVASDIISHSGYMVNFVKTRAGVIANGLMMGTIVGLMGIQHHNAEAEKHKNRLIDEKLAREKAAGDRPLPGDAPEELANMKRLIDVLCKAELGEYAEIVVNGLAVMPQRVMDVLGVVRSEAYAIVLRATQESDYVNEELVEGLMLLDNLTLGERWWLSSRGVPKCDLACKRLVSAIECDATWTPNPMIVGDRISNKETNGMPYLFEVVYLTAGYGNLRCVDINKLNIAASGIPYIICESQKKKWLLEIPKLASNINYKLSWKITTTNGVTRVTSHCNATDHNNGAILLVDVCLVGASTSRATLEGEVTWGTATRVTDSGNQMCKATAIDEVEHTRRVAHTGWLCDKQVKGRGLTTGQSKACGDSGVADELVPSLAGSVGSVYTAMVSASATSLPLIQNADLSREAIGHTPVLVVSSAAESLGVQMAQSKTVAAHEFACSVRGGRSGHYGVW